MPIDDLSVESVAAGLATAWVGRPYLYMEEVDSTNERLRALADDAAYPAGAVLLADYQSAGRGRLGRRWEAPPGSSLLFSVLLRPGWPARRGAWLTMLAGLAVAESIEAVTGRAAALKWPNDVVMAAPDGGEWRKVCGLLLNATLDAAGERLGSAVLGVGLNVNVAAGALPTAATPPTSLFAVTGRPVSRRELLLALLSRLERQYDAAAAGRSPAAAWAGRLITLGRRVDVTAAGSAATLSGVAEATDEWGQLLVRDDDGRLHAVAAGDATLRGR